MQQIQTSPALQLQCPKKNIAYFMCCASKCSNVAMVCRQDNCDCLSSNHKGCEFLYTQNLYAKIAAKRGVLDPEVEKAVTAIDQLYEKAIQRLSRDKVALQDWRQNFGLTGDEVKFLDAVITNNKQQLVGDLIHRVKKGANAVQDIKWLNQQWVENFWKKQKVSFNAVFTKLNNFFRSYLDTPNKSTLSIANFNSKITDEVHVLADFFQLPLKGFKLLYRASQDQFSTKVFHEKCDGIKHTIILVLTQHDKVVGAYTPIPWKKTDGRQIYPDQKRQTFLFSITNRQKYPLVKTETAVEHYENVGPRFGGTDNSYGDMEIADTANSNSSNYFNFPSSYNNGNYKMETSSFKAFSGSESKTVTLKEWECFEVQFADP